MNPVEPLAAPQRQHLRYLLEQGLPLASRPYRVLAERIAPAKTKCWNRSAAGTKTACSAASE